MKELDIAIKRLKLRKARDPNGWTNEILKPGNAGKDLKDALLMLFNEIKDTHYISDFMKSLDITSIYK